LKDEGKRCQYARNCMFPMAGVPQDGEQTSRRKSPLMGHGCDAGMAA